MRSFVTTTLTVGLLLTAAAGTAWAGEDTTGGAARPTASCDNKDTTDKPETADMANVDQTVGNQTAGDQTAGDQTGVSQEQTAGDQTGANLNENGDNMTGANDQQTAGDQTGANDGGAGVESAAGSNMDTQECDGTTLGGVGKVQALSLRDGSLVFVSDSDHGDSGEVKITE